MNEDLVQKYLKALGTLKAAKDRMEGYANTIVEAAERLRDGKWKGVATPDFDLEGASGPKFDTAGWPHGRLLADALKGYHQAKRAAEEAWKAFGKNPPFGLLPPELCS
jgi:hypothetical protein